MVTNSQRHVVPLQGRPYEEDQVTGLLTVEFVLKDGSTTAKTEAETRSFLPTQTLALAGQMKKPPTPIIPDLLTGAASTNKQERKEEEKFNPSLLRPPRSNSSRPKSDPIDLRPEIAKNEASEEIEKLIDEDRNATIYNTGSLDRGRKRTRTFFNTIKRKISGTRSLSATGNQQGGGDARSISQVRPNLTRTASSLSGRLQDDTSSMSNMSGISNTSAKTFVTEESSLVLETLENGIRHHYLIPLQVAKKGRFKKKGTKLHVYMDHIFVAQHIKSGSSCVACKRGIPLRMGKQAYVCRDCGIITHKPCHIKVESHCIQTSLPSMEFEYYGEENKS